MEASAQGFTVFAGALNDQEAAEMRQWGNKEIVRVVLGLTRIASVDAARDFIQRKTFGIRGARPTRLAHGQARAKRTPYITERG
jgi:hypothetical protein